MRLRHVVLLLLVLALVVPVGILALLVLVDLDGYKPAIEARLGEAIGRDVAIAGDIHVGWSFHPSVRVDDVRIANPGWASRPELLRVARLQIQLDPLSLLRGRIVLDRVTVEGADLLLETGPKGAANWQPEAQDKVLHETAPGRAPPASGQDLPSVREIRLVGGHVGYRDDRSGRRYDLSVGRLDLAAGQLDEPIRISGKGRALGIDFGLSGTVGPLRSLLRSAGPAAIDLDLDCAGLVVAVDGRVGLGSAAGGIDLVLAAQGAGLAWAESLLPAGSVPRRLLATAGPLAFRAEIAGRPEHLSVSGLSARAALGDVELQLTGGIDDLAGLQGLELDLSATGGRLGPLAAALPGRLSPELPLSLAARASGDAEDLHLAGLAIHLGDSDLTGDLHLKLGGGRPRLDGSLSADRLDLAALGGAGSQGPTGKGPASKAPKDLFSHEPLDLGPLGGIDGKVAVRVAELRAGGPPVTDLAATIDLEEGVLRIAPLGAELAGGKVLGSLRLDAGASPPRVEAALQADGLDLGTLLAALGSRVAAEGRLAGGIDLDGAGRSPGEIAAALHGRVGLRLGRGRVSVDLPAPASDIAQALLGQGEAGWIGFECGVAELPVAHGVARVDRLVVQSDRSLITGTGTVDLGKERPDLTLVAAPRVKGLTLGVPVHIGGTLEQPSVGLESPDIVRGLGGALAGLAAGLVPGSDPPADAGCAPVAAAPSDPAARSDPKGPSESKGSSGSRALEKLGRHLEGLLGR